LILQGFCPPRGVVKNPVSGYNVSYFLHAVFRTGKCRRNSRKFSPRGSIVAPACACSKGFCGKLKRARVGRGKLYRKGL
jgi:hypothetical protein